MRRTAGTVMMDGAFGLAGFAFVVILLLLALALIAGIVLLVRAAAGGGSGAASAQHALRILEERYARGEIDRDEFTQRRDDLRG
jgi:putative membrane protein